MCYTRRVPTREQILRRFVRPGDSPLRQRILSRPSRASGPSASFSPLDLSPEGYWRADLGVTGSPVVTAWANQGTAGTDGDFSQNPTGPNLVASDANFNSQPVLEFTGTQDLTTAANSFWALATEADSLTVVAIARDADVTTTTRVMLDTNNYPSGGFAMRLNRSTGQYFANIRGQGGAGVLDNTNLGHADSVTSCFALVVNGAASPATDEGRAILDGAAPTATSVDVSVPIAQATQPLRIGTPAFFGRIAELLLLKRSLTAQEDADLTSYYNDRYGLALTTVVFP